MSKSSDESYQSEILENEPQVELEESEEEEQEEQGEEEQSEEEQISDENIDLDFNQGDDDISEDVEEEISLDIDKLNLFNLYLLILKKSDNYKDFIGKIVEHNTEYIIFSNAITSQLENKKNKINLDAKVLF